MEIVVVFAVLAIGVVVGFIVGRVTFNQKPIGDLRVDRSDTDGSPYLFLELEAGIPEIMSQKQVAFRVKVENFLPHE